ncbi:MAG: hypothetical protein V4732_23025, partial [Pseudomonadota bacterium]
MLFAVRNSFNTQTEYNDKKVEWLVAAEGESDEVYLDSAGIATIGIGWNISTIDNLKMFMSSSKGLNITHSTNGQDKTLTDDEFNVLAAKILTYTSVTRSNGGKLDEKTAQEQTLIDNINNAMHEKNAQGNYLYPNLVSKDFKFDSLTQQKEFLLVSGDKYEDRLIAKLRGAGILAANENFPNSYERIALWSLTYNLGSLTNAMITALQTGDRKNMWFQIRYNSGISNGAITPGIEKRRFAEAAMFGLYGAGDINTQAASIISWLEGAVPANTSATAKSEIGGTFTNLLQYLIAFEKHKDVWMYAKYNSLHQTHGSADSLHDYKDANTTYKDQLAFQDIFKPIAGQLIAHYLDNPIPNLDGVAFAKNDHFNGDVNLGLDIDGIIKPQDFDVTGKDKNDLLIAIDDTKNNTLKGGKGDDFLIGAALVDTMEGGDDNDILVGNAGNDILKGDKGYDILYGGIGKDSLDGGADADHLYGGDGTEIDVLNGGDGNDILEGGTGVDKYIFSGNFGRDMIKDTDGGIYFGADEASAIQLTQLTQTTKDSII